jgi:hypothetical protein
MAIAIDASSPIRFTGTPANNVDITSASFTPPAGSVLVVCVSADTNGSGDNITISVSGSSLTWTNRVEHDPGDASAMGGHASIWTPADGSTVPASSQTVSVRRTAGNGSTGRISVKIYVVTGADTADPTGATGENHSTTNNITPNAYTSTINNSRGFGCATDWNQLGVPTSTDTEDGADYSGAISVVSLHKAADTATSGTTVTMNFDAGGTGNAEWNWVALEVRPGAGGTPVSSDVTTTAAISRTEQQDVTTTLAASRSEQIEVTTTAAVSQTGTGDVTTSAALSRTEQANVTSDAATTRTEDEDVTTSGALSRSEQTNVTTDGAVSQSAQGEVPTDASITVSGVVTSEVATTAAITRTEQGDVTTTGALSRTEQTDVTTTGALSRTEQSEVGTDASITVAGAANAEVTSTAAITRVEQSNVTSDAAVSQSAQGQVTSSAAVSISGQGDVGTSSAISRSEETSLATNAAVSVEGQALADVDTSAAIGPPASLLIDSRTLSAAWGDYRTISASWIDNRII